MVWACVTHSLSVFVPLLLFLSRAGTVVCRNVLCRQRINWGCVKRSHIGSLCGTPSSVKLGFPAPHSSFSSGLGADPSVGNSSTGVSSHQESVLARPEEDTPNTDTHYGRGRRVFIVLSLRTGAKQVCRAHLHMWMCGCGRAGGLGGHRFCPQPNTVLFGFSPLSGSGHTSSNLKDGG